MDRKISPLLAFAILLVAALLFAPVLAANGRHHCRGKRKNDRRCNSKKRLPRPFSKASFWNQPLQPNAVLSPHSGSYVDRLLQSKDRYGAWVNTTRFSTTVYSVPKGQPTVPVLLDQPSGSHDQLRQALADVPIPRDARPSPDSDGHIVIWQRPTNTMWELWRARRDSDGWHASFGGRMSQVSRDPGYFPASPGWGASATGLPLLGGLIRISELRRGRIPHALSLAVPEPRAGIFAWPAQRTDGTSCDPAALPEGTRFRIDPSLDLNTLQMPPFVRLLTRAAQRYGMFVINRGGAVAFYAEDPKGANPYWPNPNGFFEGKDPNQLLEQFPWSRLQALDAPLSSAGGNPCPLLPPLPLPGIPSVP